MAGAIAGAAFNSPRLLAQSKVAGAKRLKPHRARLNEVVCRTETPILRYDVRCSFQACLGVPSLNFSQRRRPPWRSRPAPCRRRRSACELEVFQLLQGLAVREVAERLFVSVKTVEAHREHIKQKLKFKTSSELLRFAIQYTLQEK